MYPGGFDPSKMDPKTLMKISELVRQLPPEKLSRMQTLMHNMMAGFDVRKEMEEFENGLPPGFREQMMSSFLGTDGGATVTPIQSKTAQEPRAAEGGMQSATHSVHSTHSDEALESGDSIEMNLREARLTLLRAVAQGEISPEDAEPLLFAPTEKSDADHNPRARV